MPDSTLSQAIKEAYASAPRGVISYLTMELRHSLLTEPIRVVMDNADLVAYLEDTAPINAGEQVTFIRYAFDLKKPEISPNGIPTVELEIDNVSREIVASIEAVLVSTELLKGTFREYLSTDLSGPQNDPPMHLDVMTVSADMFRVKATLGFPNLMNKRFPTLAYDPEIFVSLAQ